MSVEKENKWIEWRFNCDITTPIFTEQQLELIEHGFKVKPNKDVKTGTIPEKYLQEIIDRQRL